MSSFEDAVIFVHDVERAIEQLDQFAKELVATIIFQDYTQDEAAEVLRCARRTICREFPEAIDRDQRSLSAGWITEPPPTSTCGKFLSRGVRALVFHQVIGKQTE